MIIRPRPHGWQLLYILRGSIVKAIAPKVLAILILSIAVAAVVELAPPTGIERVSVTPFTLLGLVLSIFLSFRNSACYDRWWEGRKQLGQLIIEVRSLIRESLIIDGHSEREGMLRDLCGFAHSLIARLRHEDEAAALRPWAQASLDPSHPNLTDAQLQRIGQRCSQWAQQGLISEWRYTQLETRLVSLSLVQAACERIQNTPLPFPYTLLLHRTIYLFCILLPFAMAEPLGWLTPIFTAIVSYTFLGLDEIGDDLEDPFGYDDNDLPCSALLRGLEREVLAALGQTELPPLLEPQEYVLT